MPELKEDNVYLTQNMPRVFMKTALPIVLIMLVNGSFNLVDAWIVGAYVGTLGLTAVTVMFPLFMIMIALSAMVASGMSSILARQLGRGDRQAATALFTQAHIMSGLIALILMVSYLAFGFEFVDSLSGGDDAMAGMSYDYMLITMMGAPLMFTLSLHIDGLRCDGAMKIMLRVMLLSVLFNVIFDFAFVVWLELGVAGSAWGTVTSQFLALLITSSYMIRQDKALSLTLRWRDKFGDHIREIFALGMPVSLNYLGVSLASIMALYGVQMWGVNDYAATAGAFGVITRVTSFTFLPLLGLSTAFQTIIGQNHGAGERARSNAALKTGLVTAFIYCVCIQVILISTADSISLLFVDDIALASEVGRIIPIILMLFFFFGPAMIIATYFQAVGAAGNAAILNMARTYCFVLPLTFILPQFYGETGIWYSRPVTELLMVCLTLALLFRAAKKNGSYLGLFHRV